MLFLYETLLYQPIYNILIGLYNLVPYKDIGIAIIILTILVKVVLHPLTKKSLEGQKSLQELQPKLDELKEEHGDNKEALAQAMMNLYREHKVNPLSSCLPLLIQFPFIIAVYQVFRTGLESSTFELLYPFVSQPESLNIMFLGFMDLSKPALILAVLAAIGQFFQTRMLLRKQPPKKLRKKEGAKDENMMAAMNKNMSFIMPAITLVIGMSLPAGLTLYWFITTFATILQQHLIYKQPKKQEVEVIKSETTS